MQNLILMVIRGAAIGAIISAPMGPVGILCVQRTLNGGRRHGFYTGIGAAVSDLFYCLLTGFGLSFIEGFLEDNQQIIQIFGSVVLIFFGLYIMRKNPSRSLSSPPATAGRNGKDILSGFLFTFSNPLILFLIIGLFARFNFQSPTYSWYHYVVGYISIVAGAVGWWWLITFAVNKVRSHFNMRSMWIINRIIGIIILIFALYGIISAVIPEANASVHPTERLTRCQVSHSSPEPLPAIISAPGPETGRFSFIRSLPASHTVTGLDMIISDNHRDPYRRYQWVSEEGQTFKVKSPGVCLTWSSAQGPKGCLLLQSRESIRYYSEEKGGETRLIYFAPDSLTAGGDPTEVPGDRKTLLKGQWNTSGEVVATMEGLIDHTVVHVDVKGDRISLAVGDAEEVSFPLRGEVVSLNLEVPPGGEAVIEEGLLWTAPTPVYNADVSSANWATREARAGSLATLTGNRKLPRVCGIWQLYQTDSEADKTRKGGDYHLLILPSGRPDGTFDIWYLSGATKLTDDWRCGRLKGRLHPTDVTSTDDWRLEWYDAEGHPCGPSPRAHLTSDRLTLHFPNHRATLTLIRPL